MNYVTRQIKSKLSNWYIARRLGLKLNEWQEVRSGKRRLANEKLDLFLDITDPKKQEWLNQEEELRKIEEWNKTFSADRLKEFNVSQSELARQIGSNQASVCRFLSGKETNTSIKAFCYYFFNDENNRRYKKEKKKKEPKIPSNNAIEKHFEERLEEENKQLQQQKEDVVVEEKKDANEKEEVWYKQYQIMANKYHDTKEELDRYRFLIDELRNKQAAIEGLIMLSCGENEENE